MLVRGLRPTYHKLVALILVLTLALLGLVLKSIGMGPGQSSDPPARMRRELASIQVDSANAPASSKIIPTGFVDVAKLRPKPSQELIDRLRRDGPNSLMGPSNPHQIKAIMAKMKNMEDKRQQVYLNILEKRGQKVALEGDRGGHAIVSFPQTPIRMPNTLKFKAIEDWSKCDQIWRNVTHFPWPLDDTCKVFGISFAQPNALAAVGLLSYPSSGNTWLRYLIEGSTGYFTGSMYNDIMLGSKGLYGEMVPWDSGMTVAVKSHGHTTGLGVLEPRVNQLNFNHFEEFKFRGVLLIRNPFKAIIGHRHLDAGGHTGFAAEDHFVGPAWDEFVRIKIASWENFYLDWLHEAKSDDLFVIHFETLQGQLKGSLRAVIQFLGLELDPERLECTVKNNEGNFHRKPSASKQQRENPFSSQQMVLIHESIQRVNQALFEKRKPQMPLQLYEFYHDVKP
eukprot:maker-scaffold2020_size22516-snap-gene-0.5 protein:Tk04283 transcript:maker-scaffold2020_size22516-snap-gene-0.5-mRNA-1 annotation:"wsc domain-containing protein 1"